MLNFLIFMLASTLRMGTPIALTALGGLWAAGQLSAGSEPGAYADSFVDSGGGRIFIRFVPLRVYRVSGADSDSLYV